MRWQGWTPTPPRPATTPTPVGSDPVESINRATWCRSHQPNHPGVATPPLTRARASSMFGGPARCADEVVAPAAARERSVNPPLAVALEPVHPVAPPRSNQRCRHRSANRSGDPLHAPRRTVQNVELSPAVRLRAPGGRGRGRSRRRAPSVKLTRNRPRTRHWASLDWVCIPFPAVPYAPNRDIPSERFRARARMVSCSNGPTTRGRLLVATPPLGDPHFDRTVVYVLEHSSVAPSGLVLNRTGAIMAIGPSRPSLRCQSDGPRRCRRHVATVTGSVATAARCRGGCSWADRWATTR